MQSGDAIAPPIQNSDGDSVAPLLDGRAQAAREPSQVVGPTNTPGDEEIVAANPPHWKVACDALDTVRSLDEHPIAVGMSELVIDSLEINDVQHHKSNSARKGCEPGRRRPHRASVQEACEWVAVGVHG